LVKKKITAAQVQANAAAIKELPAGIAPRYQASKQTPPPDDKLVKIENIPASVTKVQRKAKSPFSKLSITAGSKSMLKHAANIHRRQRNCPACGI